MLYNHRGNPILSKYKHNRKFCNAKCQSEYYYKEYIDKWKSGVINGSTNSKWGGLSDYIRRYLFEKYNNKCCICGWCEVNQHTNKIPLEVDHIDGNSENNKEDNLRLVCPNCHSLTATYRGLNLGNGRGKTWIPRVGEASKPKEEGININFNVTKQCKFCGKDIIITLPSRISQDFCNNECYNEFNKKNTKHIPISKEGLSELILNYPFTQIAKMFNVTDNAVRKWCIKYDLPYRKKDISKLRK